MIRGRRDPNGSGTLRTICLQGLGDICWTLAFDPRRTLFAMRPGASRPVVGRCGGSYRRERIIVYTCCARGSNAAPQEVIRSPTF